MNNRKEDRVFDALGCLAIIYFIVIIILLCLGGWGLYELIMFLRRQS